MMVALLLSPDVKRLARKSKLKDPLLRVTRKVILHLRKNAHPKTSCKGARISSCQHRANQAAYDIPSTGSRQVHKARHINGAY